MRNPGNFWTLAQMKGTVTVKLDGIADTLAFYRSEMQEAASEQTKFAILCEALATMAARFPTEVQTEVRYLIASSDSGPEQGSFFLGT